MPSFDFQVNKNDLSTHRLIHPLPTSLSAGQVRLSIERFALTANNITYGVAGDMIGYWQFFPAENNWGRIPVWVSPPLPNQIAMISKQAPAFTVITPCQANWL